MNECLILTLENGARNPDCPHYDGCLELAADLDWPAASCQDCPNKDFQAERMASTDPDPSTWDGLPYFKLLLALFRPDLWEYWLLLAKRDQLALAWAREVVHGRHELYPFCEIP